jgi:glyoxylase-like metal-dependent hydrolase (beta-lactamase superfamily II)
MTAIDTQEVLHLLNRRRFLAGSAALAAAPLMPWKALALSAASFTFTQGDAEVTVVSDGTLSLPLNVIAPEASPEQLAEIAKRLGWPADGAQPAANAVLIKIGTDLILVDNGSGNKFQPTAGKLAGNLAAAGIDPTSITKVVFTHAHPDHIWGTLKDDGTLYCPNATYHVGEAEWNFWTDPDLLSKMPADMGDLVKGVQRDLAAVKERVTMVKNGQDIVTGLSVVDTPGHTPGHISLQLAGGEGLLITGDATTNQIVSFEHPDWRFGFDADHDTAIKTRQTLLDRAATDKLKLIGFHWLYPGVGFAERNGTAYRYTAVS